ncbi:RNA-DNA and DNA-DNA helicase UvsW domain protein [Dickeya phage phiDP23.1]|nr:RNA-DNA and DNA-DNA helicase UvsW domain protein [Dickeya phage phiDP10.3]AIM51825.1 RNA-DNA and DNA-DNA helicase UvsW domain protein [Dickeya phage phiDP23.1]
MAINLKGNVAIMFERIDAHMMVVYEMLSAVKPNVFVINGDVAVEDRLKIGSLIESEKIITLEFGNISIMVGDNEKVLLSNGETKVAMFVTEEDDVDDNWIKQRQKDQRILVGAPKIR